MKYRITYICCHKTSRMELSLMDDEFSDEDMEKFVFSSIEHYKEEDGLGGLPHEIIKSEISIDGDIWFASDKFIRE